MSTAREVIDSQARYEIARNLLQKFGKLGSMEAATKIVNAVLNDALPIAIRALAPIPPTQGDNAWGYPSTFKAAPSPNAQSGQRPSTPAENLRVMRARLSEHLSPAEDRELEEAARLLEILASQGGQHGNHASSQEDHSAGLAGATRSKDSP